MEKKTGPRFSNEPEIVAQSPRPSHTRDLSWRTLGFFKIQHDMNLNQKVKTEVRD